MRKYLTLIILVNTIFCFSQKADSCKNYITIGAGYTYNQITKPIYVPFFLIDPAYPPGYYLTKPSSFSLKILDNRRLLNNFYLSYGIQYLNKRVRLNGEKNIDSIIVYYYPNSNWRDTTAFPLIKKRSSHLFEIPVYLKYKFHNFNAGIGLMFNFLNIDRWYNKLTNNEVLTYYSADFFVRNDLIPYKSVFLSYDFTIKDRKFNFFIDMNLRYFRIDNINAGILYRMSRSE